MTKHYAVTAPRALVAATLAAALSTVLLTVLAQPAAAQPRRTIKFTSLSSLTAAGFEIKAVSGNQAGVIGTLVLQKDKDVYMCDSKDLSIQPTAFQCWPVQ
jgi:hypothetical protein